MARTTTWFMYRENEIYLFIVFLSAADKKITHKNDIIRVYCGFDWVEGRLFEKDSVFGVANLFTIRKMFFSALWLFDETRVWRICG